MNRKFIKDRNDMIDVAREILSNKEKFVILDTETTGLGNNDVVIQIGIIDLEGNILLDTLIRPTKRKRISRDATAVHGITMKMLTDAPTFKEIYPKFCEIVGDKTIITYNAQYDARLIAQTAEQDEFKIKEFQLLCAMIAYSQFVGEWSDYHRNYKYQKLIGGDHTAIGDCKATLKILQKMANTEKTQLPKRWWQIF